MSTKYDNTDWYRLSRTGGAVVVTLAEVSVWVGPYGRGNDGISLPCKGCWIAVRDANVGDVYMSVEPDCTPFASADMARPADGGQPFWVPVSDVAQLSFCGEEDDDMIDIVYLLG